MKEFDKFLDNNTTAIDSPIDSKAIYFWDIATDDVLLEDKVLLSDWHILNQWATNRCVAVWTTDWINNWAKTIWLKIVRKFIDLVNYIRNNIDDWIDQRWTWIKNWAIWARKLSWIKWFSYINTLDEIKKSLTYWMSVNSWTNKLSWSATRINNYIAVLWKGWWHDMNICWYDDNLTLSWKDWREETWFFIIENSWWNKWWDNGYYYVPYSIAEKVFFNTKISMMVDIDNTKEYARNMLNKLETEIKNKSLRTEKQIIRDNIDLELAKEWFDLWIFNWLNPRESVSRQEVVVMNIRSIELVLKLLNNKHNTNYTISDLTK